MSDVIDELRAWLDDNRDPDLTVAQWRERLGLSGWAAPSLPENAYGKGLWRNDAVRVAQAPPIYGGTDQVQRNIIGERVLGLPTEPGFDRSTPFAELPKNAEARCIRSPGGDGSVPRWRGGC